MTGVAMGHPPGNRRGVKNHAAFDKDVFFDLAPDLVVPEVTQQTPCDGGGAFWKPFFKGLFDEERFRARYSRVALLSHADPHVVVAYARSDYVASLRERGLRVVEAAADAPPSSTAAPR